MTPHDVLIRENLRASPFCETIGCAENEIAAAAVVAWLAVNGDEWGTALDLERIGELCNNPEYLHAHRHSDGELCYFSDWLDNRKGELIVSNELRRRLTAARKTR